MKDFFDLAETFWPCWLGLEGFLDFEETSWPCSYHLMLLDFLTSQVGLELTWTSWPWWNFATLLGLFDLDRILDFAGTSSPCRNFLTLMDVLTLQRPLALPWLKLCSWISDASDHDWLAYILINLEISKFQNFDILKSLVYKQGRLDLMHHFRIRKHKSTASCIQWLSLALRSLGKVKKQQVYHHHQREELHRDWGVPEFPWQHLPGTNPELFWTVW